jgi:hypothetical protein
MVTCDFCGQASLVHDAGLDPTGRTAKLTQLPSPLYVDASGQLAGRRFRVMGRLRYQHSSGVWDEWFLTFEDDRPGWLVEDEGTYTFYAKETIRGSVPPFESLSVGSVVSIAGRQVFVTEKGEASIAGGEGQLAFTLLPGEQVRYVDGTSGDVQISVEYTEEEIELSVGHAVTRDELVVDEGEFW